MRKRETSVRPTGTSILEAGAAGLDIAIVQDLFVAEKEEVFVQFQAFVTPESSGDEWPSIPAPTFGCVA